MSTETREILERLERGEIDSQDAIHMIRGSGSIQGERPSQDDKQGLGEMSGPSENTNHYLRVDVHRLHDKKRQVHVRVPLRIVELGLTLGSKYAPELNDFNLKQIVDELHEIGEGTIVEVEDVDDNQHVLVWIEKT